jgi:hypothetical protein
MTTHDDLLQPSLNTADAQRKAIYSTTAGYLTAFIGGPFAAIAMAAINSGRLRRLARDAVPLAVAILLSIGLYAFFARPEHFAQAGLEFTDRSARFGARLFALLLFGAFWLLHKRYYRGAELLGLEQPNPWVGGIACVVFGTLATYLVNAWLVT